MINTHDSSSSENEIGPEGYPMHIKIGQIPELMEKIRCVDFTTLPPVMSGRTKMRQLQSYWQFIRESLEERTLTEIFGEQDEIKTFGCGAEHEDYNCNGDGKYTRTFTTGECKYRKTNAGCLHFATNGSDTLYHLFSSDDVRPKLDRGLFLAHALGLLSETDGPRQEQDELTFLTDQLNHWATEAGQQDIRAQDGYQYLIGRADEDAIKRLTDAGTDVFSHSQFKLNVITDQIDVGRGVLAVRDRITKALKSIRKNAEQQQAA